VAHADEAGDHGLEGGDLVAADEPSAVEDPLERRYQLGAQRLVAGLEVDERDVGECGLVEGAQSRRS
jgi:hypothetical protein